jgi:hypothetical protein
MLFGIRVDESKQGLVVYASARQHIHRAVPLEQQKELAVCNSSQYSSGRQCGRQQKKRRG